MRKIILVAFAALMLMGVSVATASAALPEFSAKTGFTGKSGTGTLTGPLTIKCSKDSVLNGTMPSLSHVEADVHFEGCTILGIPVNTTGDSSGVILLKVLILFCYLTGSTKASPKVGAFTELKETVVIKGLGQESEVKGSVIGEAKPLNTSSTKGEDLYKKTNPASCTSENEGKGTTKKAELLANLNGGKFEKAEEETTEELTFEKAVELKA
ncbi:MAG TPA: hypothetical protein VMB05_11390 [Solirubrobacteraceae bacterium]|nr:hypothetical protein [Solirubrobacteraceae bacterium]